jgi:hypothetical protein
MWTQRRIDSPESIRLIFVESGRARGLARRLRIGGGRRKPNLVLRTPVSLGVPTFFRYETMSTSALLSPENKIKTAAVRPTSVSVEPEPADSSESLRFEDELWPWVQLPDGRLELVADAA